MTGNSLSVHRARLPSRISHAIMGDVSLSATLIGFFLGFAFGVGCALAVMYSIYAGGYRAAVNDSLMLTPPERLKKALQKARGREVVTKN